MADVIVTAPPVTPLDPTKIHTASLYPLATLEARTAGTARVLITRYWPRGLKRERVDAWWRDLAPSESLLAEYHDGATGWDNFAARYYLQQHGGPVADMAAVVESFIADFGAVTLLCVERCPRDGHDETDIRCHRRLLRELLIKQTEGSKVAP